MALSRLHKILFVIALLLASTPASLAIPVTKVRLKSDAAGPIDLYFSAKCCKIMSLYGAILISKNGYFAFNDQSKSYIAYKSADAFVHSNFGKLYKASDFQDPGLKLTKWRKGKDVQVFALKSTVYERDVLNAKDNKFWKVESVTVTKDLPTDLEMCSAYIQSLSPCPEKTFPLIVVTRYDSRTAPPQLQLSCASAKKTDLPLSFFDLPKGYKKARDDIEVFIGGSNFDQLFFQSKDKK